MFSIRQKREIADAVQRILRGTNHPELPSGEINFLLRVEGAEDWSWAEIKNNGSVKTQRLTLGMRLMTGKRKREQTDTPGQKEYRARSVSFGAKQDSHSRCQRWLV
jgi:hypothetical protein